MIHIHQGDLLASDCTIIGHQANCFANMGAGIAKQIARQYPEARLADEQFPIPAGSKERLGQVSYAWHKDKRVIFNLYGQFRFGKGKRFTEYDALQSALVRMLERVEDIEKKNIIPIKVGLPYKIGCGLAGGEWKIVQSIIEEVSDRFSRDIHLYRLD